MEDKNLPLTDDLYIKMNARGKVLTDFENFKVDLLKYKLSGGEYLIPENDMSDESFRLLLDTRWTDLFWHYRSTECHIDEIYMSFLNRFFLNWYIAHTDESADKIISSDLYKVLSAAETGRLPCRLYTATVMIGVRNSGGMPKYSTAKQIPGKTRF